MGWEKLMKTSVESIKPASTDVKSENPLTWLPESSW